MRLLKRYGDKLLEKELKASYRFFIKEANVDLKSEGYGLIKDKDMYADEIASIASVGYGLAALTIGCNRNWISYPEAYKRVSKTLDTFLNVVEGKNGFFYHFVNMDTGKREWDCEISIIDTAIFICGAILVGEFFQGRIKQKAEELYRYVNFDISIDMLKFWNDKLDYVAEPGQFKVFVGGDSVNVLEDKFELVERAL